MKVQLVNITNDAEKQIIYIARVSNPDNQNNPEYSRLLRYLIRNKHFSPFEHAYATFEIKTSRAIATQILRHRSFTFQEFSQRYSTVTDIEPIELRKQADKNRQSSTYPINNLQIEHNGLYGDVYDFVNDHLEQSIRLYQKLVHLGVAKESARFVLPLATSTTLYMTGSIRSWLHYLELRTDEHTQKEHRIIAAAIKDILKEHLPVTFRAVDEIEQQEQNDRLLLELLTTRHLTELDVLQAYLDRPV